MKKAIITGVLGQDGYYLAEFLLGINYFVYGIYKKSETTQIPTWQNGNIKLYEFDLNQIDLLENLINEIVPDEIYHLAAYHFSSQHKLNNEISFQNFSNININVIDKILSVVYRNKMNTKIFYASSSHIFGNVKDQPQTELTPYDPNSFYSISKIAGSNLCKYYREQLNLNVSVGILYNHESIRRNDTFISTMISKAAAEASLGKSVRLEIRNLNAIVDWGAAQDYVIAMWKTLQNNCQDDYIIASGIKRTINDFALVAFRSVGLDASNFIVPAQNKNLINQFNPIYIGNPKKIQEKCGWYPSLTFEELVTNMVQFHISNLKHELNKNHRE